MEEAMQADLFTFTAPAMPTLDVSRCKARIINYETASNMVKTYHYAHRVPSIVLAVGMYVDDVLAGCCSFGTPATANTRRLCGEDYVLSMLELNRLYIHDWAGRNSESWLVGQAFKIIRRSYPQYLIVLSYADADEHHIGYIYQATNFLYTGSTGREHLGFEIGGKVIHRQTINDRYGTSSVKAMARLAPLAVPVYGTTKHRYVYFLGNRTQRKTLRKALRWPVLPYPKG